MRGDFDRVTFDPTLRFANVLLQQGRLLLPSDFNEQGAIVQHFLRRLVVDLVGPSWRPSDAFIMTVVNKKFVIGRGHWYVNGLLCENDEPCLLEMQSFALAAAENDALGDATECAFIIDCWERHITALDLPQLRDSALNGRDTATRVQIAWRVRPLISDSIETLVTQKVDALNRRIDAALEGDVLKDLQDARDRLTAAAAGFAAAIDCKTTKEMLEALDCAPPRLAATVKDPPADVEPCVIAADAQYRGRENQLYRVEIHRGGPAGVATFKWSRENGSVAFRILDLDGDDQETRVSLESVGRDKRTGLKTDDWVELTDRDSEVLGPVRLLKVKDVDVQNRVVTLLGSPEPRPSPRKQAVLRRWDQRNVDTSHGEILIDEGVEWMELERGLKVRFEIGGVYSVGLCWLITARVASGDIEWPHKGDRPLAVKAHGGQHHRAALCTATKAGNVWSVPAAADQCGCRERVCKN